MSPQTKRLFLVHTSATLVPIFQQFCAEHMPAGVDVFHISDDSLIKDVIARGELTPATARRVVEHIGSAERAGADLIMATCSSIGAAVEAAAPLTSVPVLRVDQPMADQAVSTGARVGVIATLPTTLAPTTDLIERRARALGRKITVTAQLAEGAFEALMSGDAARHDSLVAAALKQLAAQVDVIVLAQASMARVVDTLPDADKKIPILASPPLAIAHLAQVLA